MSTMCREPDARVGHRIDTLTSSAELFLRGPGSAPSLCVVCREVGVNRVVLERGS